MEEFTLIRSDRTTVGLRLDGVGKLVVRAPYRTSEAEIRRIIEKERVWIERERERQKAYRELHPEPDETQRLVLVEKAKTLLPPKIEHYAALMGVRPTRVTITGARTRFGSCSGKNALSFSWRLMQYPEEAIDYVVVHELAHIRHHDHSPAFYRFIASVMPDHEQRRALLRK